MSIRVTHSIHDLANDAAGVVLKAATELPVIVQRNVRQGREKAQSLARASAGPHGKLYYKRITDEMLTPLSGEYGPEGTPKTEFVGAGYRNGGPNMDLPNSADIAIVDLTKDVHDAAKDWFW